MKSVLAALSPCRHPKRWFAINLFVLAWSAILLVYIIIYINRDEDDIDKTDAEWNYLLYNFVACAGKCLPGLLGAQYSFWMLTLQPASSLVRGADA